VRTLRADDLDLELERPAGETRGVIILVPGLFATSQFFRVDADVGKSVARVLHEDLGLAVVHFDPRGLGRNHGRRRAPIDFASRVDDLRRVVEAVSAAFAGLPLFLFGHSFGGTTIHALVARGEPRVRATIAVGSPARLVPRAPPWDKLFALSTTALVEQLAREDWLDLAGFTYVQNKIYSGAGYWRWLSYAAIRTALRWTARSRLLSALNVRAPKTASLVFRGGHAAVRDYSARELRAILRAGTLQRESVTLLAQLLSWGRSGGAIALPQGASLAATSAHVATPTLVAFSAADDMVRPEEACAWDGPASVTIDVGACGHAGFFYKKGPRALLLANIESFLRDHM
jgi:pimeloyl-ACP methyl ester carboxylesterase